MERTGSVEADVGRGDRRDFWLLGNIRFKFATDERGISLATGEASSAVCCTGEQKLVWLLRQLPERIEFTKLPVLDVQRRVRVLAAAEHVAGLLDL